MNTSVQNNSFTTSYKKISIYFLLWSLISWINGIFPFNIALKSHYNVLAMILVILIFSLGLTLFSLSKRIETVKKENRVLFRSIWIGYILTATSFVIHLPLGIISIEVTKRMFNAINHDFVSTFFITFLMGVLLNIIAIIFVALVYYCQMGFIKLIAIASQKKSLAV